MEGQWCTIESDPKVFKRLACKLGVLNVQFEEVLDLDSASLQLCQYERVYGFVFLFKWKQQEKDEADDLSSTREPLIFIQQNVTNACATISILHLAFNNPEIELSDELKGFKDFITELPSDMRGMALTNSEAIRKAHNSFISLGSISQDQRDPSDKDGEAFHFVAVLPVPSSGVIVFDGMKEGPLLALPGKGDLSEAIEYFKGEIERSNGELTFSILAMIPSNGDDDLDDGHEDKSIEGTRDEDLLLKEALELVKGIRIPPKK